MGDGATRYGWLGGGVTMSLNINHATNDITVTGGAQLKVNGIPLPPGNASDWVVKNADFIATINTHHWLATTLTAILPSYAGLTAGTRIPFSKAAGATPIIQAAPGQNIRYGNILDTSVQFSINAILTFVFNGTEWEV